MLTLQVDGQIVTHRVVEVRLDGTFVTRGDANDALDDFSANDVRVVGEYRFSLPFIGKLLDPIESRAWFSDQASSGSLAAAEAWDTSEDVVAIMWSGDGLTWEPVSPEPTVLPSPSARPPAAPSDGASPTLALAATPTPGATTSDTPVVSWMPTPTAEPTPSPHVVPRRRRQTWLPRYGPPCRGFFICRCASIGG